MLHASGRVAGPACGRRGPRGSDGPPRSSGQTSASAELVMNWLAGRGLDARVTQRRVVPRARDGRRRTARMPKPGGNVRLHPRQVNGCPTEQHRARHVPDLERLCPWPPRRPPRPASGSAPRARRTPPHRAGRAFTARWAHRAATSSIGHVAVRRLAAPRDHRSRPPGRRTAAGPATASWNMSGRTITKGSDDARSTLLGLPLARHQRAGPRQLRRTCLPPTRTRTGCTPARCAALIRFWLPAASTAARFAFAVVTTVSTPATAESRLAALPQVSPRPPRPLPPAAPAASDARTHQRTGPAARGPTSSRTMRPPNSPVAPHTRIIAATLPASATSWFRGPGTDPTCRAARCGHGHR